jgi:hypothetical protein
MAWYFVEHRDIFTSPPPLAPVCWKFRTLGKNNEEHNCNKICFAHHVMNINTCHVGCTVLKQAVPSTSNGWFPMPVFTANGK